MARCDFVTGTGLDPSRYTVINEPSSEYSTSVYSTTSSPPGTLKKSHVTNNVTIKTIIPAKISFFISILQDFHPPAFRWPENIKYAYPSA